jgi:folate-binding protein YgfZ
MGRTTTGQGLDALEHGRAFADLSSYRKVRVGGSDARAWLHDLVTCDVETITPGMSRRSLLLSPTGRIRADFAVAMDADGFILLQVPDQPEAVGLLLGRYVLSSDVTLTDRTDDLALFAFPGRAAETIELPAGAAALRPSVLGSGLDLLTTEATMATADLLDTSPGALEAWRVRRGVPRMGADFGPDSSPAEAGLESAIDLTKGCFLGQEAVAKVRNLGHPPRVLRHVRIGGVVMAGARVMAGTEEAGTLTSAVRDDGATVGIARVRWAFADAELTTEDGAALSAVGSMD